MSTITTRTLPLFRRALSEGWRGLLGWMLGLTAIVGMYVPLYPSIGCNPEFIAIIESLPPELVSALNYDQITTSAGYTQGTVYGLLGFALVTIAAVVWGASAIAGDEERGTLELVVARGAGRTQLVLERLLAVVAKLVALAVWVSILVLALNEPSELGLEFEGIVAGGLALLGSGMLTATIGIAVGALTGRRGVATGAAAGVAVLGYALSAIANQSADLEWLRGFSPYAWAYHSEPLANGLDASLWALYSAAALMSVIAVLAFRRRDIGV